jgi:hypothetical protein
MDMEISLYFAFSDAATKKFLKNPHTGCIKPVIFIYTKLFTLSY